LRLKGAVAIVYASLKEKIDAEAATRELTKEWKEVLKLSY